VTTTTYSQSINGSLDTAVASGSISTLTDGSYAIGSAIDNRPTSGSVVSYDLGDLRIPINSATPTSGGYVKVYILPAIDSGTSNYASPNSAAAAPENLAKGVFFAVNAATTEIAVLDIPIPPYSFKVLIQNKLGVSITASSNAQMQRKTLQSW
jgi:hypothetical protein